MATVPESQPGSSPVTDDTDFGANDWLLEEMYEQYRSDPNSVDAAWAQYFATHGDPNDAGGATGGTKTAASARTAGNGSTSGAGGNGRTATGSAGGGANGASSTSSTSSPKTAPAPCVVRRPGSETDQRRTGSGSERHCGLPQLDSYESRYQGGLRTDS